MDLKATLVFLQTTAGVNFLIGAAWSYLVEFIPGLRGWFDSLSAVMKRVVIAAFSLAVPLIALILKLALGFEVLTIDVIYGVLSAWAMAFFGSQAAHTFGPAHPARLGS